MTKSGGGGSGVYSKESCASEARPYVEGDSVGIFTTRREHVPRDAQKGEKHGGAP